MKVSYVVIDWLILNKMKPRASHSPDPVEQERRGKRASQCKASVKLAVSVKIIPPKRTTIDWSKKGSSSFTGEGAHRTTYLAYGGTESHGEHACYYALGADEP
ncbi:MAG: hypothetical protein P8R37_07910 [Opitutae bacterium]|nr:hypothetical protein [Opitutae bacterium]MDG1301500.1 hypothetical protein [Opitutae bacterium]